jgi:ABC-2 type transport system permease protein
MFTRALQITGHYLVMTYRSRVALIFSLLMPLVFTIVLGVVLGQGDSTAEPAAPAVMEATAEGPVVVVVTPAGNAPPQPAQPTGFSQSSPGMLVTFGLASIMASAITLLLERQSGTLRRLMTAPLTRSAVMGGKLGGVMTAGVLQAAILIAAGALFFRVNWGQAPLALAVMVLAFAFSVSGLGMLIAGLAKTYAQANALSQILTYSTAALGGAWWPIDVVPEWMQRVAQITPAYWAMKGFQDIIVRGQGMPAILPTAAVLALMGVVFLAIGLSRFKDARQ